MNAILILIAFSLSISAVDLETETIEAKRRDILSIFDIIFENWRTLTIASVGIAFDLWFKRIPYPIEKNTTRLFSFIDEDNDKKVDLNEFETYLVKLFHVEDVVSFEKGRRVSAADIAKFYKQSSVKSENYRWNCFIDRFDINQDSLLDFSEFKFIRMRKSQALSCIVCIKYRNHCIDFHDLYLIKP